MLIRATLLALLVGTCLSTDEVREEGSIEENIRKSAEERNTFSTLNTLLGSLKSDIETKGRSFPPPPFSIEGADPAFFHDRQSVVGAPRNPFVERPRPHPFVRGYSPQTRFLSEPFVRDFHPIYNYQPNHFRSEPIREAGVNFQRFDPRFAPRFSRFDSFPPMNVPTGFNSYFPKFPRRDTGPEFGSSLDEPYIIVAFSPRSRFAADFFNGRATVKVPNMQLPKIKHDMTLFHSGGTMPVPFHMLYGNIINQGVKGLEESQPGVIDGMKGGIQGLFEVGIHERPNHTPSQNQGGNRRFGYNYRSADLPSFGESLQDELSGRSAAEPSFFYLNPRTGLVSPIWKK